ncbi:MAG: AlpA family phage regulatory protein [Xanthobacteraceae bacterium]|jgi:predicted DNA-binding transcriptional regulator AlpA
MEHFRLNRIIRVADAEAYCGLRRTQRKELEARGEFPRSVPLSDGGRARGYLEDELIEWQQRRLAKRDASAA